MPYSILHMYAQITAVSLANSSEDTAAVPVASANTI